MVVENGEFVYMNADSIIEFEEDELLECYLWVNKINERKDLMAKIDVIRSQIQNIYHTMCLTLYQIIDDCCMMLKSYLDIFANIMS